MCFTRERRILKKNKVVPYMVHKDITKITTDQFIKEYLTCEYCKQGFDLQSNEVKIHCAGCDKFFHCGIAGKCDCTDCKSVTMSGACHNLSWCVRCAQGNYVKNGVDYCRCKQIKDP